MPGKQIRVKIVKQVLAVLLLLVFLFNIMGYYFVFKVNQSLIHGDIRAMINSGFHREQFILVRVENPETNPGYKRLDIDEFVYCGKLYDIVNTSKSGNVLSFWCVNDKEEELLVGSFEKVLAFASIFGTHDKSKQILALLQGIISIALVKTVDEIIKPDLNKINFPKYFSHFFSHALDLGSPPPKY